MQAVHAGMIAQAEVGPLAAEGAASPRRGLVRQAGAGYMSTFLRFRLLA